MPLETADLVQPLRNAAITRVHAAGEKFDRRHRARRERPCSYRAAEQCDEVAAHHHSITSSARAMNVGVSSRPSTLAVFRLTTRSNFFGSSTGRSAGLVP